MMTGKEILTLKREITLQAPRQPALVATVTDVEEDLFWTNLPREGRQVLVLLEGQNVNVGVSLNRGFYSAETTVKTLNRDNNRFYGLAIPDEFNESLKRSFIRAYYATNVLFKSGNLVAQSALINFSAGGVMVYLVPELEKILKQNNEIFIHVDIENFPIEVEVRFAWRKAYDNIPFGGFEFINITPRLQGALAVLAMEYSKN